MPAESWTRRGSSGCRGSTQGASTVGGAARPRRDLRVGGGVGAAEAPGAGGATDAAQYFRRPSGDEPLGFRRVSAGSNLPPDAQAAGMQVRCARKR